MPENTDYKRLGELERAGAETLPPTDISAAARELLQKYGITEQQILQLQEHTSQFRYDLCTEKVQRLASAPAEIYKTSAGKTRVNLREYFDTYGRHDGQCGDIASRWIISLHESGLIQEINAALPEGMQISIMSCYGNSETHFCTDDTFHIWNGLGFVSNGELVDQLYIDASFQVIKTKDECAYRPTGEILNPKKIATVDNLDLPINTVQVLAHMPRHKRIFTRLLTGTDSKQLWRGELSEGAILGISESKKYVFSLGFVQYENRSGVEMLTPAISRIAADGSHKLFLLTEDNTVLSQFEIDIEPEEEAELLSVLLAARKLQFSAVLEPGSRQVVWEKDQEAL